MFKSCRRSSFSDFFVVLVFETMHIIGLTLLFFVVLPELDVVKGAMLTNCVCFIPSVLCKCDKSVTAFIVLISLVFLQVSPRVTTRRPRDT